MADDYTSQIFNPNSGGMADVVQRAILGQQQQTQNNNLLEQQNMALNSAKAQQMAAGIDPKLPDDQYEAALAQVQQLDPATAQQARTQRAQLIEQHKLYADMVTNPSAQNIFGYMAKYPQMSEGVKRAYDVLQPAQQQAELRTMTDVAAALNAGKPEVARDILTKRAVADKAAGIDTSHYDQINKLIDDNPAHSRTLANLALASVLGKDKFAEAFPALSKLPGEVAKGEAEAVKAGAEASAAPQIIATDIATKKAQIERMAAQTQNEIEQLKLGWAKQNLDADTLATNTAVELQKLAQTGREVKGVSLSEMTQAVGKAQSGEMLANQSEDLADKIAGSGARGGMGSSWAEWMKRNTGLQDPVSMLRAQYQQVINQQAIKNLPPGPASDKDIQFARQAFPKPTDPPEYVAQFLKGLAKMQRITATADARRADWISANGDIGTAKDDLQVGGVLVPKGTTFLEFNRNQVGVDRKKELPSGIAGLLAKYGGKK